MSQEHSIASVPAVGGYIDGTVNGRAQAYNSSAQRTLLGLPESVWIKIGVITVLFCALFWPNLRRLWDKTNPFTGEANWGHAICVPIVGLYYLYVNRERLLSAPEIRQSRPMMKGFRVWVMVLLILFLPLALVFNMFPDQFRFVALGALGLAAVTMGFCLFGRGGSLVQNADEHSAGWFGAFVMLFGIAVFGYGIFPGQNDFVKDFGMVTTLFGVVLMMAGWHVMETAWFPIAFLVCAIPWPGLLYSRVASPLQQLAAHVAVWTLEMTRVESSASGTKIVIMGYGGQMRTLNVAEACAGLRSLMTFVSVGAAVAFLSAKPLWQRLTITLTAIPIAIFCNVMRVSGQGLLDHYVSQQLSENFAHQFVGMIMLIPAFLLILLVGWILDQIFVEEVDRNYMTAAPNVIRRAGGQALPTAVPSATTLIRRKPPQAPAAPRPTAPPTRIAPPQPKPVAAPKIATAPKPPLASKPVAPRPTTPRIPPSAPRSGNLPPPPSLRLATRPPRPIQPGKPNPPTPPGRETQ